MAVTLAFAVGSLLAAQSAPAAEALERIDGVFGTFPAANDDVPRPRNLRPLAFGATPTPPVFTLSRGDASVVIVESVEVDVALERSSNTTAVFAVTLPPLEAGEEVTLEGACDGCFTNAAFGFRIGDAIDASPPAFGPGSGRFGVAFGLGGTGFIGRTGFEVEVCLPGLAVPEDVMVRFSGPDLLAPTLVTPVVGCDNGLSAFLVVNGGAEREVCVDAVAVDVVGLESPPITVCGPLVDGDGGCAASPSTPLPLLGLALLARRRRARGR